MYIYKSNKSIEQMKKKQVEELNQIGTELDRLELILNKELKILRDLKEKVKKELDNGSHFGR